MAGTLGRIAFFIVFWAIAGAAVEAAPERRVALVIGNSAYRHTATLPNPRNDAQDVAAALQRLGFAVIEGIDLDKRAMEQMIRQFAVRLASAEVALFFYAGHGLQISGQNFLLPVDARLSAEGDVDFETIPLGLVLKQMERDARTSLVLLDACRNNPLVHNLVRSMGTRSAQVGQGLAEVRTGVGTLIGFSTQPGNVALDGAGRNSPYAQALLKHVEAPGLDITTTLINVRNDVVQATGGQQVPWEHTSLMGQVVLSGALPQAGAAPDYDKRMEIEFWDAVKDSKSPELLRTYTDRFPNGTFSGLARVMIARAEEDRSARGDQESPGADAPSHRSQANERETASIRPGHGAAEKTDMAESESALTRDIQRELARVGCDPGDPDGKWGPAVKNALARYDRFTQSKLLADRPTRETLAALTDRKGRACPLQCGVGKKEVAGKCVASATTRPAADRSAARTDGQACKA